ncbi:MAG TPA: YbhN family protein [Gaiellaceae bacterium]|nr:YbhN family protein [Gaiellaceae bacterium]
MNSIRSDAAPEPEVAARRKPWRVIFRILLLLATAVSLYFLFPSLVDLFTQWHSLADLEPQWILLAVVFEAASVTALWEVQRIALRTPSWFAVGTSQLAGNAAGNVIPGGAATAGAFAYRLLVRAGVHGGDVAGGLAAVSIANTTTILAFPLLALPAILGGLKAPDGLLQTAYIGAGAFVLVVAAGLAAFLWDRTLLLAGRSIDALLRLLLPSKRDAHGAGERLLQQRDGLRHAFGARWPFALCAIVAKPAFDYLGLLCCLAAVGARPDPSLVVLAYSGSMLLALIPFTPGGLGFVEAGLTGLLTLAGASTHQAVVATLAYRLLTFWLPLPLGGIAYLLHRRRYGTVGASASATSP